MHWAGQANWDSLLHSREPLAFWHWGAFTVTTCLCEIYMHHCVIKGAKPILRRFRNQIWCNIGFFIRTGVCEFTCAKVCPVWLFITAAPRSPVRLRSHCTECWAKTPWETVCDLTVLQSEASILQTLMHVINFTHANSLTDLSSTNQMIEVKYMHSVLPAQGLNWDKMQQADIRNK